MQWYTNAQNREQNMQIKFRCLLTSYILVMSSHNPVPVLVIILAGIYCHLLLHEFVKTPIITWFFKFSSLCHFYYTIGWTDTDNKGELHCFCSETDKGVLIIFDHSISWVK